MTGKIVKLGVALVVAAAAFSAVAVQAVDSPETLAKRKLQREINQRRNDERKRQETNLAWVSSRYIDGSSSSLNLNFDSPIIRESSHPGTGFSSSSAVPPPPSPGLAIGQSSYDYQHNDSQGYQTARISGADLVHFVWMAWDRIPASVDDNDRYVAYNSYTISTNTLNQGFGGQFVGLGVLARAGYINMDAGTNNEGAVSCHQREDVSLPYNPWHLEFSAPPTALHLDAGLGGYAAGGCPEVLWPRNAASRDAANTGVRHLIAHSNTNDCPVDLLWYWRYDGTDWQGPVIVDSTPQISYVIADDPNSNKLALGLHVSNHVFMNGINNVAYMQSTTDGVGWINNTEAKTKTVLTNYTSDAGNGAWLHISITYDNSSVLHVMWDEQEDANDNSLTAIRHWNSSRNTIRPVALNYAETPLLTGVFNLNLTKVTMGIGDGGTLCQGGAQSNNNYVYAVYVKMGGSTLAEQEDASLEGYYNGELYLSVSNSGGNTWAPPVNLTNTKTPNCNPGAADTLGNPPRPDSVCRSEHWSTIGRMVDDIDIFFVSDKDAGGIPQGEGTWQMNPVHYLRIPGGTTDAQHVCPVIAPNFVSTLTSTEECEYHATTSGQAVESMSILNLGNATLSGNITITDFAGAPTLTLSGGAGAYSIPAGNPDIVKSVTMAANGAAEGLYTGQISITHNATNETSPFNYPIEFFVFNEFFCPVDEVLKTGVASPGSLALEVESNGRFASQNAEGGLWRHSDSSSTVFDGSLLVSHGAPGTDSTVFLRFFSRNTSGQFGYRAQGDLAIDTSAYGSNAGYACATAQMSTRDSVVGVQVEWVFPQTQSADEVVIAHYKFYRHNNAVAISNLAVGILVDADAIPASRLGSIQSGATNEPGSDGVRNLVWVGGVDTIGHSVVGTNTATRFRGGIAVPGGFEGAIVGNNVADIQPSGGPSDGFLYSNLQNLAGIDLYSVADTDLYVMIALDKGKTIAVGETLSYDLIFVSDTISEASLKSKVDAAAASINTITCASGCSCPCYADPAPTVCDGITDVLDVVGTVNVAFRGFAAVFDPGCPRERTDVNCDGATDVLDVVRVVNVAFRGFTPASQFNCDPCL
jgi:hypothetical protein